MLARRAAGHEGRHVVSAFARVAESFWDAIEAEDDPVARKALEQELADFYRLHGGPPAGLAERW